MYSIFVIAGINVAILTPFPTIEDCRVWRRQNEQVLIALLETLPVQAPGARPLLFCSQKPPKAGETP